jgi:hypothetical protein
MWQDYWSLLMLIIMAAALATTMVAWHKSPQAFDLKWLVVDTKTEKVSLSKVGQLAALLVSTWGFVVLIEKDRMSEWFFMGYMLAWTGANLANKMVTKSDGKGP